MEKDLYCIKIRPLFFLQSSSLKVSFFDSAKNFKSLRLEGILDITFIFSSFQILHHPQLKTGLLQKVNIAINTKKGKLKIPQR